MKNFARSLLPMNAPIKRKKAKTQPDTDMDEMAENSAPILQPPASLAPYPMSRPPRVAATTCFKDFIF